MSDTVYYAIGDIHGEDEKLARLHEMILEDANAKGGEFKIVHLGDLIDRGAHSRAVVERVMALEKSAPSITIMGNHEQMMLDAFASENMNDFAQWSLNGGDSALRSYEAKHGRKPVWREAIDPEHLEWLRARPIEYKDEDRRILFVHAGIDPARYPDCSNEVKLWTRSRNFMDIKRWPERPEVQGLLVVHGHTPTDDFAPDETERRINIDTGACYGGALTCVALAPAEPPRFLRAR